MTRDYAAVFRRSALTHRPSVVFEAAQRGPVLIEGGAGQNLVVETEAAAEHRRRLAAEAARVLALDGTDPGDYPRLPGFAWTAPLETADRARMAVSLRDALRRAVETGAWDEYDLAWYGWQESARALEDDGLVKRLLAPSDPTRFVPIARP